jgi:hypothetical protein
MSTAKLSATSATSATQASFVPPPPVGEVGFVGSMRPSGSVRHTSKCSERGNTFQHKDGPVQNCNGYCITLEKKRQEKKPQQQPQQQPPQKPQQQPQQQPEQRPVQQPQAAPVVPVQRPDENRLVSRGGRWRDDAGIAHDVQCSGQTSPNRRGLTFSCKGACLRDNAPEVVSGGNVALVLQACLAGAGGAIVKSAHINAEGRTDAAHINAEGRIDAAEITAKAAVAVAHITADAMNKRTVAEAATAQNQLDLKREQLAFEKKTQELDEQMLALIAVMNGTSFSVEEKENANQKHKALTLEIAFRK